MMRSADEDMNLARENRLVLYGVQALLGLVDANFVAVSVNVVTDQIVVNFWLKERSAESDESISEIIGDIDGFLSNEPISVTSRVYLGQPQPDWSDWAGRMIYWIKAN